ncbi:MAG: fibronectin type III domain-containing protein [Clostridiales bacterium]|nr:fibronectin type III domain-containing protein [Clostridiales bacterium]
MKKIYLFLCAVVIVFFSLTFTVYAAESTTAAAQDTTTTQTTTQVQECKHTSCEMKVKKKASLKSSGTQVKVCKDCGYEFPKEYTIRKIKSVKLSKTSYVYSSEKKRTPKVTVLDSKSNEISSDYYDVTYEKGRKNVGTYTVTVKFKGKYSGSKTLKFKIVPKSTSISKVTSVSRGAVIKWKKQDVKTTGYQITYSKNSDFESRKTVTGKGKDKTKVAILNLSGSTKYYFKVRTYKTVDGKNYYSSWSTKKSITTKKESYCFCR